MKHYIELSIECINDEMADIVTAFLADFPFESFDSDKSVEATTLRGYIDAECWADCRTEALMAIADYGNVVAERVIESENWNARWEEESFHPVVIEHGSTRVVIRAPYHQVDTTSSTIDIIVSPQMSFGSGHHLTTRLMCRHILSCEPCTTILDVGCGTGVLSIVALKSIAHSADAIDIDEWSTKSAEEASILNGLEGRLNVILGTVELIEGRSYDMVMANINRNIILADIAHYVKALKTGGYLLLSGFLSEDVESIMQAAKSYSLEHVATLEEENWVSLKLRKN